MFTISTVRCFLCKKNSTQVFYAHATLCPGSVEPLKTIIENLARSAKMELHLTDDTLLCLECCKFLAAFIEEKQHLLDRLEKGMAYFDNELHEEPIVKEENMCEAETAQDPILDANIPALSFFIDNGTTINNVKENDDYLQIKKQIIEDENLCAPAYGKTITDTKPSESLLIEQRMEDEQHTSGAANEEANLEVNFSDNEIIQNEQTATDEEGKKFKCNLCNFAHYSECHVVLHKNTHRGLEELQCPFCLKLLSKKSHTIRHMRTHTNFGKHPTKHVKSRSASSSYSVI